MRTLGPHHDSRGLVMAVRLDKRGHAAAAWQNPVNIRKLMMPTDKFVSLCSCSCICW